MGGLGGMTGLGVTGFGTPGVGSCGSGGFTGVGFPPGVGTCGFGLLLCVEGIVWGAIVGGISTAGACVSPVLVGGSVGRLVGYT